MLFFLVCSLCIIGLVGALNVLIWNKHLKIQVTLMVLASLFYISVGTLKKDAMNVQFSANRGIIAETLLADKISGTTLDGSASNKKELSVLISSLEKELGDDSKDLNAILLLARLHMELDNFSSAVDFYKKANSISPDQPELLANLADAIAMKQGGNLNGEPQSLIMDALKIDPSHKKSLAIAAAGAMNNQDTKSAVIYWKRLKATLPEESSDSERLKLLISALEDGNGNNNNPANKTGIKQNIILSGLLSFDKNVYNGLKNTLTNNSALFLILKEKSGTPIPIAVKKIPYSTFAKIISNGSSLRFELTEKNIMRPNIKINELNEVVLFGRLSFSGEALPNPNDLLSNTSLVKAGTNTAVLQFKINR